MISAKQLHRAAMLSNGMYTSRAITRRWSCENLYNDTHLFTRSVDLSRNLIGDVGHIKVAVTELGKDLYVGFSGTQDAEFWLYNINGEVAELTGRYLFGKTYTAHLGFMDLTEEVFLKALKTLPENFKHWDDYDNVIFTGHSAGGAVAALMPFFIDSNHIVLRQKLKVIDYGSPRVWASKLKYPYERHRFQHVLDIVPCTPLTWCGPLAGFSHTGTAHWTTEDYSVIDKPPWYRIFKMLWRYGRGIFTLTAAQKAMKYHSSHQYSSTVLANYFKDSDL